MTETLIGTPDPDGERRHVLPWAYSTPGVIFLSQTPAGTTLTRVGGPVYVAATTTTAGRWAWSE